MPARQSSSFVRVVAYMVLAAAGLSAGFLIYVFFLLGQPLRTNISIIDPASFKPISLDEIQLAEEEDDVLSWSEGGRTRVYVHPDFPIKKVAQRDPNIENILVFGIDSRGANDVACRADSLIVVTIDKKNHVIKLTSILRDTRVKIAGRTQENRINASYAFGGAGLLINTINDMLDLDIQRFAMFDFWSAARLIDSVGGIELDVSEKELPYLNQVLVEMNELVPKVEQSPSVADAGLQRLDGRQAIAWARIRKLDSDYARANRQRTVIMTLLDKFADAGTLSLISLINNGLSAFETNMRSTDMIRIALNALPLAGTIQEYQMPQNGLYKVNSNPWMMIVDWDKQVPALHEFIWGKP
jgi:polyisoprenyl-teichoic acid--peptidoglycan teichoic acid transferase